MSLIDAIGRPRQMSQKLSDIADLPRGGLENPRPQSESRRNSQGLLNLEGSSSSHSWEEAYSGREKESHPLRRRTMVSPNLWELCKREPSVSEILDTQFTIRWEPWFDYLLRVVIRLTRIDQLLS